MKVSDFKAISAVTCKRDRTLGRHYEIHTSIRPATRHAAAAAAAAVAAVT